MVFALITTALLTSCATTGSKIVLLERPNRPQIVETTITKVHAGTLKPKDLKWTPRQTLEALLYTETLETLGFFDKVED